MPGVSQKFPPEQRDKVLPFIQAVGPLAGALVNPNTNDVTVSAVAGRQMTISALIWDALGFLDIVDQQQVQAQQQAASQAAQLAAMQQELAQVQTQMQSLQSEIARMRDSLGVVIPNWEFRSEVVQGIHFITGVPAVTAESLGLIVEFVPSGNPPGVFGTEPIVSITPPPGTLVARGSKVVIVHEGQ